MNDKEFYNSTKSVSDPASQNYSKEVKKKHIKKVHLEKLNLLLIPNLKRKDTKIMNPRQKLNNVVDS